LQTTEVTDPAAVSCVNSADLAVTKNSGPDTDTFGQVVSSITVTNNGPDTATNVNASDNVDSGLTVVNVTCSDGGVATIADPAECDWASIPNAGVRTMTVTSDVDDDQAGTTQCNTVGVTMSNGVIDGTPGNDTANDCNNIAPANVNVTKTDGLTNTTPGSNGTYTITITNAGPSHAANVVASDTEPAGVTFGAATCSPPGVLGGGLANPTCTWAGPTAPGAVGTMTIPVTYDDPQETCNTVSVDWNGNGAPETAQDCTTVAAPFWGFLKDTDGGALAPENTDRIGNLWICVPHNENGLDDDGDSTVDEVDEGDDCPANNLVIEEKVAFPQDCDSPNDDDDDDGKPIGLCNVSNTGPGIVGTCDEILGGPCVPTTHPGIDHDGGELGEGLGAYEFQFKADHKIFDWPPTIEDASFLSNGGTLDVNCSMTIVTENWVLFGCVTTGNGPGQASASDEVIATVTLTYEPDLVDRIRPTKDNGVVRAVLDENCELADRLGDPIEEFPGQLAGGLTPDCGDAVITIRMLEGDLDNDCDVDIVDEQFIAFRYGTFFGSLFYDPFYDLEPKLTGDFDIDIKDVQFVFGRDGSTCTTPIPDQPPMADAPAQP
jgi:uncharacterized repeat protein (TIGR01451 family)